MAGNYVESPSSGSWALASADWTSVTNLAVTITVSGRPVMLALKAASNDTPGGYVSSSNQGPGATFGFFRFMRDGEPLPTMTIGERVASTQGGGGLFVPCSAISYIDTPSPGTYTYRLFGRPANQAISGGPHSIGVSDATLFAIEL